MKATTLENRIAKNLTTKKNTIEAKYEKVIEFIKKRNSVVHPRRWNRNGSHYALADNSHHYIAALTLLGIDFETGNDAPRGGMEGFFIRLSKKGRNQVREFAMITKSL